MKKCVSTICIMLTGCVKKVQTISHHQFDSLVRSVGQVKKSIFTQTHTHTQMKRISHHISNTGRKYVHVSAPKNHPFEIFKIKNPNN